MPTKIRLGRVAYYILVLVFAVLINQDLIGSMVGPGVHGLLRRNSEAYAMMFLVPLYWDIFAAGADPRARGEIGPNRSTWLRTAAWFGAILVTLALLDRTVASTVGLDLSQSVVTLQEAFLATLVVTAYLAWSRSLLPTTPPATVDGHATVSAASRLVYYVIVVLVAIAVEQSVVEDLIGSTVVEWMRLQTEAFAAMVLLPLYFDVVAPSRSRAVRIGWYAMLVAIPVLTQGGLLHGAVPESLRFWVGTTTEAYIAAFGISLYFDFWRPRV